MEPAEGGGRVLRVDPATGHSQAERLEGEMARRFPAPGAPRPTSLAWHRHITWTAAGLAIPSPTREMAT